MKKMIQATVTDGKGQGQMEGEKRDSHTLRGADGTTMKGHSRTRAPKTLEVSEERYRSLFEQLRDALVLTTRHGEILEANPAALDLFGYGKNELFRMNFQELYANPGEGYRLQQEMGKKGSVRNFETRLRAKSGREMDCILDVVCHRGDDGDVLEYQGIIRDITETKQAQEALRASQERLSQIIDFLPDATMVIDLEGRVIAWNRAIEEMTGIPARDMLGKGNYEYAIPFYGERRPVLIDLVNRWSGEIERRYRFITRKGDTLVSETYDSLVSPGGYLWSKASPLYDHKGKVIGAIESIRDITEKIRAEARLHHAEKMEAIAILAGGIAHEFNNALMGIMGNIELLRMDLPELGRREKYFRAMKEAGLRMSSLTDQLLAYARGGKYRPNALNLNEFFQETVPILGHDLGPEVRVETHISKDVSHIRADHAQMQMVLSALVTNADEAMEEGGVIKITARDRKVDRNSAEQLPGLKPGSYVCITVEDDGRGMDEETRQGIFEPFFTTKFQGRGMGMAAVYGIVKNHGGFIYVDSAPGKGTRVGIYLPAIDREAGELEDRVRGPGQVTEGSKPLS